MTPNKRIYAITGGIGCGKTAVSDILRELSYAVFSCDRIYAELTQSGGALVAELERAFGCVTTPNGTLDRRALSKRVFGDAAARKRLDSITHPVIMRELLNRAERAEGAIVFCEVPLLFENGFESLFNGVIVVMRSLTERINAVMARSGLNEKDVLARIQAQFDYSTIDLGSYYVIENNGDMDELRKKVKKILQNITKLA